MHRLTQALLILLATTLALWWLLGFWQPSITAQISISLILLCLCGGLLHFARRKAIGLQQNGMAFDDNSLPPESFSSTVILVCGDSPALFPDGAHFRQTRLGWYIPVNTPEQLPLTARRIDAARPALSTQIAILLAIIPEQHHDMEAFTQSLRTWHRAIIACRSELPFPPHFLLSTWLTPPQTATEEPENWFTVTATTTEVQVCPPGQNAQPTEIWYQNAPSSARNNRLDLSLWLNNLLAWGLHHVDSLIGQPQGDLPALQPCARGYLFTTVNAVNHNLWQQHLTAVTQLSPPHFTASAPLPLPDCLLSHLPQQRGISMKMRTYRTVGFMVGLFLLLAMLSSWQHNRRLILGINDHLKLYQTLPGHPTEPKAAAQRTLRDHLDQLNRWQSSGEPLRYDLGLYQGTQLIAPLQAAINGWAPAQLIKTQHKDPQIVRLDTLSLFDTGKWQLKPGSTKVLVNALVDIKAKPGWLIVIAGHTDNTGNEHDNQRLSQKRAESVRDWMRDTGSLPESCFAVQGYGQSRPLKNNDTPEGRSTNRRVEISLVPQADACRPPGAPRASS